MRGRDANVASVRPIYLAQLAVLAAAYYGVGRLGLAAGALTGNVTPVWPPTGLAIAVVLILGYRMWPGVAAGALLVNGLSSVPFLTACGMSVGNTLEAVVGAYLLTRVARVRPELDRVRDVVALTTLAAGLATILSATTGVLSLRLGGVIPASALWPTWRVWWVGDALGALVVIPVVLALRPRGPVAIARREAAEATLLCAATAAATWLAFSGHFDHPYVVFPLLIWAALRWRLPGAALGTLLVSSIAVLGTKAGHGAFATGTATHSLWMLDTFLAVVAVTGLVLAAVVTERDKMTAHNAELTADLRRNVADLEVANRELEAFTYSVSHDLRAPLRNIDGFSRMLLKGQQESLDEQTVHYLTRIRTNAHAMGHLIDELLSFSRLQRQPIQTQRINARVAVDAALAQLESARANRDVELVIGRLPDCDADPGLLTQVFANLISNALKFTASHSSARIEIGTRREPGHPPAMFVRDDGVGFDMTYAHKMFGVFQRLHRAEDYDGSGVGLAIVHRIVTRHGGRVWAEGAVDGGATVYLTLEGPADASTH